MMIRKLEDLPNEILTNIFEYISSPNEIYRAFVGQNHRFNSILQHIRLSIDIYQIDQQNLLSIRYFSSYCDRLRLYNISPSISLNRFSRLRSLTIIEPTEFQTNSIRPSILPMLEYLAAPPTMIIFDGLFGDEQQRWLNLHSCYFLFFSFPTFKNTWKPNFNLHKLSGISCSRVILHQLLLLVPSLEYLQVEIPTNDDSNWVLPLNINSLISLRIEFLNLNYDDLSALLGKTLRRLYIEVHHINNPIDFVQLGDSILLKSPKLKQFNCDYRGNDPNMDDIRNAHSIFKNITLLQTDSDEPFKLICKLNIQQTKKKIFS